MEVLRNIHKPVKEDGIGGGGEMMDTNNYMDSVVQFEMTKVVCKGFFTIHSSEE